MTAIDVTQPLRFPPGFLWGTATAGHQVEGGNVHSNWWAWEKLGLVNDGTTSGRACDYWNRYAEDHELMQELGLGLFRLGVEWARIEPRRGEIDRDALGRYRAILEDLRRRGIEVCLTLNHWVIPAWMARRGGWLGRTALDDWARFVRLVAVELGDLVGLWVTLNEPMVPILAGYLVGYHPPCRIAPLAAARVFARLLRAHALAHELLHAERSSASAGYAAAMQYVEPYHSGGLLGALERRLGRLVAQTVYRAWDESVATGRVARPYGRRLRVPGLAGSLDYCGVNYYMRVSVRVGLGTLSNIKSGGHACPEGTERTEMGWQIHPPGFYEVLQEARARFGKPIHVTENGCCDSGDEVRRRYLAAHIAEMHRAIRDGCDVKSYMLWSFIDNFEWREGFAKKFGIVAIDRSSPGLERIPRPSATMYRDIAAANALTPEILRAHVPGAGGFTSARILALP